MFRPDLPSELACVVDTVRGFGTDHQPTAMCAEERAAWLSGLQQLRDAVTAFESDVLSSFDANGDGETLHGARTTRAWLKGAVRIGGPLVAPTRLTGAGVGLA
jgi:hypothetical protein